jgi:flagellar hook assembly protein FlgD
MSQINAFDATDAAVRSSPTNRFSELSSEDFIKIIFTELSKQDPFQPNDSSALLEQLNSIRSIESDVKLQGQLKNLVFENQLSSASGMIGKFIGGLSTENQRVAGFVVSVIRQGENVNLELDNGWIVPIGGVETVINPDDVPEPDDTPAPSDD